MFDSGAHGFGHYKFFPYSFNLIERKVFTERGKEKRQR